MSDIQQTGPKDVFFRLAETIALYAVIVSFGSLVFQLINFYFPDSLAGHFDRFARENLRWPVSVLVVVFPLFAWISWKLQKEVIANPAKRGLRTRKWLMYLTLFLASVVIAVDLITLIFRFLGGELTTRFSLKVLTVLVMAGAVFTYYGWNLRKDILPSKDPRMRFFIWGVVAIVVLALVAGFFVAGSPQSERLRRFDSERVGDLQNLQFQIVEYWQTKRTLPASLDALSDDIIGFVPPVDPQSGELYEYKVTGDLSFELCAVFNTESEGVMQEKSLAIRDPYAVESNWEHKSGRVCFNRTIDPDRFPPRKAVL
ncbi:MAG: hypothetical protein A3C80_04290 [Candidatus Ryanbacteria bacterium RIFCSPHIGHO2_02_FULL_45_43]|uniref:DUF5671 domain-containing protein n=1 Tax=Candidatus Ryanbacteria bacterium RIFCSPHIGHO2_01_45_13 TaxID=1802112 RepID=A0A1G2FXJ3_9BACT|nr:MAG: hypothetical protein A2718_00315 [Candidatus Ryanbacteria bacterium RIFCSPHIGHO2_01_FULL_44_130]OGZ42804.1 MAG: hypothetical protein A2W41_00595 [Candidatus Ryanbacteria bacterium RIFCSPHIGHO2_01_45_13]OGZ48251.1 MAG: hypothetical protein A3C80_04290 [Candidatus Ryanbacteria bacterium RIFCSPHIGHO2_02_FULL_45_43]OGZ50027.1 MAG: hypothetical protein A3E55_01950 [Candidatus Ryanbacteria bacterium RIFCSPHIGHO2_12_FULL_44_20]OGZ51485.1 MAG: hypothetical protein A3A17_01895 [Candidatus Ryanba